MSRRSFFHRSARRQSGTSRTRNNRDLNSRANYRRALRVEPLEDRRLLALVTVDTLDDIIDLTDGRTSLREAIFATNLVDGPDTIEFAPALTASAPATILLTQGELRVTDSLTITGPGAHLLTIDASASDPTPDQNNGDGSRIFNIDDGIASKTADVSLSGLTLTGGDVIDRAGAILNYENLTLRASTLTSSAATIIDGPTLSRGGAIAHAGASLTITNSLITGNSADFGGAIHLDGGELLLTGTQIIGNVGISGAGIYNDDGVATVRSSHVHDNVASSPFALGGGIYTSGNLSVVDTTITGNSAAFGAGIFSRTDSAVAEITLIANSTISGNTATVRGGGVRNALGRTIIQHSTITENHAPPGQGAGVASRGFDTAQTEIRSTIIAGNFGSDVDFVTGNINTFQSGGHNLIGAGSAVDRFNQHGDQIGIVDPLLGPLANNGGPTLTHALLLGSPAINAGDLNVVADEAGVPLHDQRGAPFVRVASGRIDIGAFEYQLTSDLNLVVDTLEDTSDGDYSRGNLSLREAIELANLWSSDDTIRFDPTLTANGAATILLTHGELRITDDLSINGPGVNLLTIDASGNDPTPDLNNGDGSRVLNIENSQSILSVAINSLAITGGDVAPSRAQEGGGAIRTTENLSLDDVRIYGNSIGIHEGSGGGAIFSKGSWLRLSNSSVEANTLKGYSANGGGIAMEGNRLDILNSKVIGNVAADSNSFGGGIYSRRADVWIENSTVSGNVASYGGGVFFADNSYNPTRTLTVINSTISSNRAASDSGGGIYFGGRQLTMRGSTIIGNSAIDEGGGIKSWANTVIDSCAIIANRVERAARGGGGISVLGNLEITDSTVLNNSVEGWLDFLDGEGGGILSIGTTSINNCIITGNNADSHGGGVYADGLLSITDSAIRGNWSRNSGGGLYLLASNKESISISNTTISTNYAGQNGGGIHVSGPDEHAAIIKHSTIANNTAGTNTDGQFAAGGGIFVLDGALLLDHTLVAENSTQSDLLFGPDISGLAGASISARYSLVENNAHSGLAESPIGTPDANGNRIGGPKNGTIRARIVVNSGGVILLPDSPAISAGDSSLSPGMAGTPQHDQRGTPFQRVHDGRIDIGAYERQSTGASISLVVDTLRDEIDGDYSQGDLSLREAIMLANGNVGWTDTISFAPQLSGGQIRLQLDELVVTDSVLIDATDLEDMLVIDSSGFDPTPDVNNRDGGRAFLIDDGDDESNQNIVIAGLKLIGGDIGYYGGAIWNEENLRLERMIITDNSAWGGAGVYNVGYPVPNLLFVKDSVITGNSATLGNGGGILSVAGGLTVVRTTISENEASNNGGGISASGGSIRIDESLIAENFAGEGGGGINARSALIQNSTIRHNTTAGNGGGILSVNSTIDDSVVDSNSALRGGGISGSATIRRTSIVENSASLAGGGIHADGMTTLFDTTISGNTAAGAGGGIVVGRESSLARITINQSTLTGNSAAQGGGVAVFDGGVFRAFHSTIIANTAQLELTLGGGGIWSENYVELDHTIVALNDDAAGGSDISSMSEFAVIKYSLVGDGQGITNDEAPIGSPDANGNLIGGPIHGPINPLLGPLADNGGPTLTHALLLGSPAINMGDPAVAAGVDDVSSHDQRGAPFTRVYGGRIDIGAFELQPTDLLAGDYNADGIVNAADYTLWRDRRGTNVRPGTHADGNADGTIDDSDYILWKANFGASIEDLPEIPQSVPPASAQPISENATTLDSGKPSALPGDSVATSVNVFSRSSNQSRFPSSDAAPSELRGSHARIGASSLESTQIALVAWLSDHNSQRPAVDEFARSKLPRPASWEDHGVDHTLDVAHLDIAFASLDDKERQ